MSDNLGCVENIFWYSVFLLDFGGVIALVLYALARWPVLIKRADALVNLAVCLIPLVLIGGFLWTHVVNPYHRGVMIHGIHYEDFWSDD